jgi:hypothetical protein
VPASGITDADPRTAGKWALEEALEEALVE